MKIRYRINRKTVSRKIFVRRRAKAGGIPMVGTARAWPMNSLGLGVHPSQVTEFNTAYAKAGITGARQLPNGECELSCNSARNAVLKLRGIQDNDAGYGQHVG